jgi:hypothetical protein
MTIVIHIYNKRRSLPTLISAKKVNDRSNMTETNHCLPHHSRKVKAYAMFFFAFSDMLGLPGGWNHGSRMFV